MTAAVLAVLVLIAALPVLALTVIAWRHDAKMTRFRKNLRRGDTVIFTEGYKPRKATVINIINGVAAVEVMHNNEAQLHSIPLGQLYPP